MISGLDDVVVAETVLSDVDGQAGRLVIRGHSLDDLVDHASFERVVILLWGGFFEELPEGDELTGTSRSRWRAFRKPQRSFKARAIFSAHHSDIRADVLVRPDSVLRALEGGRRATPCNARCLTPSGL